MRKVARHGDEPIVRVRADRDGAGTERSHQPVGGTQALGGRRRSGRQEPGRALEELRRCALGAARLGAADRMTAHEAGIVPGRGGDRLLRGADVGDRAALRGTVEHLTHGPRELADRRGDEDDLGAGHGGLEARHGVDRAPRRGDREKLVVGIPADDVCNAGAPRGEPDGSADEPRAHDRETSDGHAAPQSQERRTAFIRPASSPRPGTRGRATAAR